MGLDVELKAFHYGSSLEQMPILSGEAVTLAQMTEPLMRRSEVLAALMTRFVENAAADRVSIRMF